MDPAEEVNRILETETPAAFRCLSPLGKRAVFPRGIPFQSAQAKTADLNATIGQVTDGSGKALPLPMMEDAVGPLDPKVTFLYGPQDGAPDLRKAWQVRQQQKALGSTAQVGLPLVTHGMTQGLSLTADLFSDPDTDVIFPDLSWENYNLIFNLRSGARLIKYSFYRDGKFNPDGLKEALQKVKRKALIVVNLPANPAGYMPTPEEATALADVILAHKGPAVALFDDAYQGMVYEKGRLNRSLFWDVAERADPERLFVLKADGATKELFFFGGRVGFLTAGIHGEAEKAFASKVKCLQRATSGVCSGPAQAMVLRALQDPELDEKVDLQLAVLRERYQILKTELAAMKSDVLTPLPFNAGVFCLVKVREDVDAELFRQKLLKEQSVGVISVPSANAFRLAFCSVSADRIPELVKRIEACANSL